MNITQHNYALVADHDDHCNRNINLINTQVTTILEPQINGNNLLPKKIKIHPYAMSGSLENYALFTDLTSKMIVKIILNDNTYTIKNYSDIDYPSAIDISPNDFCINSKL